MQKIFILLAVHNRKLITERFVDCLLAQTHADYHLVLIDDGSTDGTAEMVRSRVSALTVLVGHGNWWWAGSLQQGVDWLHAQRLPENQPILIINDDVSIQPNYLAAGLEELVCEEKVMILSKFFEEGDIKETGICASFQELTFKVACNVEQINCLSTRGLFLRWGDIKLIGNFHPKLLPHYLSDYEYTIRGVRKGLKCKTSNSLFLTPNYTTTGYHTILEKSRLGAILKLLSKKSASNPIYWTIFLILACPAKYMLKNIWLVWIGFVCKVIKILSKERKCLLQ